MQRNEENLEQYKRTVNKVMERADNRCEVVKNGKRCLKYIPQDSATFTNFLHTETRNGKSDEWVLDPENIVFGCAEHHYEEERTGIRVERCSYEEVQYLPEE